MQISRYCDYLLFITKSFQNHRQGKKLLCVDNWQTISIQNLSFPNTDIISFSVKPQIFITGYLKGKT